MTGKRKDIQLPVVDEFPVQLYLKMSYVLSIIFVTGGISKKGYYMPRSNEFVPPLPWNDKDKYPNFTQDEQFIIKDFVTHCYYLSNKLWTFTNIGWRTSVTKYVPHFAYLKQNYESKYRIKIPPLAMSTTSKVYKQIIAELHSHKNIYT